MDQIELPRHLKRSKCLEWNFKYDKFNVLYLIIRHIFPETASIINFREIPEKYLNKFNIKNFTFPLDFDNLKKFVKKNSQFPITLKVLYESEIRVVNLGTISNIKKKKSNGKNVLYLLMVKHDSEINYTSCTPNTTKKCKSKIINEEQIPFKYTNLNILNQQHHFFKIKNLRGFLNNRHRILSKDINYQLHYYYCGKCLLNFRSKTKKQKHEKICEDKQQLEYPEKNSTINFDKQRHKFKTPVIGFCDFESVLQRNYERLDCKVCSKPECLCPFSTSSDINMHRPVGYSILFIDSNNEVFFQEEHVGTDAVKHFLNRLKYYEKIVHKRKQRFKAVKQMNASAEDWHLYQHATVCHICKRSFDCSSRKYKKVVDHDHVTGKMVGAAHSICNLFRSGCYRTPIFFHNAQG